MHTKKHTGTKWFCQGHEDLGHMHNEADYGASKLSLDSVNWHTADDEENVLKHKGSSRCSEENQPAQENRDARQDWS